MLVPPKIVQHAPIDILKESELHRLNVRCSVAWSTLAAYMFCIALVLLYQCRMEIDGKQVEFKYLCRWEVAGTLWNLSRYVHVGLNVIIGRKKHWLIFYFCLSFGRRRYLVLVLVGDSRDPIKLVEVCASLFRHYEKYLYWCEVACRCQVHSNSILSAPFRFITLTIVN